MEEDFKYITYQNRAKTQNINILKHNVTVQWLVKAQWPQSQWDVPGYCTWAGFTLWLQLYSRVVQSDSEQWLQSEDHSLRTTVWRPHSEDHTLRTTVWGPHSEDHTLKTAVWDHSLRTTLWGHGLRPTLWDHRSDRGSVDVWSSGGGQREPWRLTMRPENSDDSEK